MQGKSIQVSTFISILGITWDGAQYLMKGRLLPARYSRILFSLIDLEGVMLGWARGDTKSHKLKMVSQCTRQWYASIEA
jgi:hypothetical protein